MPKKAAAKQFRISVGIRARPLLPSEKTKGEKSVIRCENDKGTVVVWDPTDETVRLFWALYFVNSVCEGSAVSKRLGIVC